MKRIQLSILIFATVFLSAACEDVLLEEPVDFVSPESIQSEEGAVALLIGAYEKLQVTNYYRRELVLQLYVKADYGNGRGTYAPVGRLEVDARNFNRITDIWGQMYQGIDRANVIIGTVPDLPIEDEVKTNVIAEAKVLRAFHYFHIVRLWGAAPLRLQRVEQSSDFALARSSVGEIYDQILADLEDAISSGGLVDIYPLNGDDFGRVTLYGAKTLRAHVNLTLENYAETAAETQEIMDAGLYSLEPDLENLYRPEEKFTHSGEIWSIPYTRVADKGNYVPTLLHNANLGYSNRGFRALLGNLDSPLLRDWDDADLRKSLNLYDTDPNTPEGSVLSAAEPMLFKKYIDSEAPQPLAHGNNSPLYRYADVLTMFAEADAKASGTPTPEAYEALNQVRRRGYGVDILSSDPTIDYSGLTLEQFNDAVLEERGYEFMVEAKRWYDLARLPLERIKEIYAETGEEFGDEDLLWPIPNTELENNEELGPEDQNPGYVF